MKNKGKGVLTRASQDLGGNTEKSTTFRGRREMVEKGKFIPF
jgi:hypothetical protein